MDYALAYTHIQHGLSGEKSLFGIGCIGENPPIKIGILAEDWGWKMRPEARDKVLARADECARALGGKSFQDGIDMTRRLLAKMTELLDSVRTPEMLTQRLDETHVTPENEWLLFALFKFGPQLARWIFRKLSDGAADTLPPIPSRRPPVSASMQVQMLHFVNELNFQHGVDLATAKGRAARRFGCGVRTVERYWTKRIEILAHGPELCFNDLIEGIKTAMEDDT